MSLYNFLDKNLFLPLGDIIYGSNFHSTLKVLEKNDFISEKELQEIQNKKLQNLISHAYSYVPYYKKLFDSLGLKPDDVKTREDLVKLPILTKQIIRDNYYDMHSTGIPKSRIKPGSTGGSTGTPLKYCEDKSEWSMWKASTFRAWGWYGLNLGDKIFSLVASAIDNSPKWWSLGELYQRYITRNLKHSTADVNDASMKAHYEAFMKYKPSAIRGYGSTLYIFALYIEKNHLPIIPLKAILTTGEMLMPQYRAKLEEVFNAPLFDAYGAGDGGILSHECPCHSGFHITEEACIIEIADKNGNILPDDTCGFVLTTDLGNYAFPFIRYQVGDLAYLKKEKCSCGRQTKLIGEVMGRCGKLMYNKQGVPISPTMLPIMLYPELNYHIPEYQELYNKIDKFQIRQDKNGDIEILLKMKQKADENIDLYNYIVTNYQNHFADSSISLKFVDQIPTLPSGKDDYCISEYKSDNE